MPKTTVSWTIAGKGKQGLKLPNEFSTIHGFSYVLSRKEPESCSLSNQLQLKTTPFLLLFPPRKNPSEINHSVPDPRRLAPLWCARTRHLSPLLLSRFTRKGREHGRVFGLRVFSEVLMGEDFRGRGAGRGVQGEEGGEEGCAGRSEVGEFAAEDGAVHAWVGGKPERAGIGEAFVARPCLLGGEAEEFEDLKARI